MKIDKYPLTRLIDRLSDEDRQNILREIQCGKYSATYEQVFKFYSSKKQKKDFSDLLNLSNNRLAKIRYWLGQLVMNYQISAIQHEGEQKELLEAKIWISVGLPNKAIPILIEKLKTLTQIENYQDGELIYQCLIQIPVKSSLSEQQHTEYNQTLEGYHKLRFAQSQLLELNALWTEKLIPFVKTFDTTGQIVAEFLKEIKTKLSLIGEPVYSQKAQILYFYLSGYIANWEGDFDRSKSYYLKVLKAFEHGGWLLSCYADLYPKTLVWAIAHHGELGDYEGALKYLKILYSINKTSESVYKQNFWGVVYSQTVMAEYFLNKNYLQKAKEAYNRNEQLLQELTPANKIVNVLFYILIVDLQLGPSNDIDFWANRVISFSSNLAKQEIQVYARIIHLITTWVNGEWESLPKLLRNYFTFFKKAEMFDFLPQATIAFRFFRKLNKNPFNSQLKELIAQTIRELDSYKPSNIPESRLLDFKKILLKYGGLDITH